MAGFNTWRGRCALGVVGACGLSCGGSALGAQAGPSIADWNRDGEVTVVDFVLFNNDFQAGDADVNGDGETTVADFVVFINEFKRAVLS
ncbi:MAG: GC-type dockerin domain-anchored protein [Planctomycetota bacterium]